jgi:hypothetical protein
MLLGNVIINQVFLQGYFQNLSAYTICFPAFYLSFLPYQNNLGVNMPLCGGLLSKRNKIPTYRSL